MLFIALSVESNSAKYSLFLAESFRGSGPESATGAAPQKVYEQRSGKLVFCIQRNPITADEVRSLVREISSLKMKHTKRN